ncbi:nucleotidyltransferase, partial [Lachnospiraceae bacterium]|nr:nucleotidyltransferase [Lachnospiraceae bacterium]
MNEVCIEEDKTILEAMKQLDTSGKKVLFVQKEGKLLASLTDGDVRRWILKKGGA